MKRSQALAPLSRDHHVALVVAQTLTRADAHSAAQAADRFASFLERHELGHFRLEESILLPALPGNEQLAQRVRSDHDFLRQACARMQSGRAAPSVEWLHEVGSRLRAHVQMEEQELFPYLEETLDPDELSRLGARLELETETRPGDGRANVITGVRWIMLPTHDLKAAMQFYGDTLGLKLKTHRKDLHWAEFEAGNVPIALLDAEALGLQHNVSHNPIAFMVDDIDEARATLESRGVTFDAETLDAGQSRMATFRDPDGNALMLHQRQT
jgi:predicted enzyme related to lactoylglutathione lyase/hemerythrin-like domain-containing protein